MRNDPLPTLELAIPWEVFQSLPRHPAYRYAYRNGTGTITFHPRYYHCVLDLARPRSEVPGAANAASERITGSAIELRPLQPADWHAFGPLFEAAFHHSGLLGPGGPEERIAVAQSLLATARLGGNGPLLEEASSVAVQDGRPVGAALVTLVPDGNLQDFSDPSWGEAAPADAISQRWGRPHLTWIFVAPDRQRRGIGERLLSRVRYELLALEYRSLASTLMLGDHPSLLWHWKAGFQLLPYVGSPRRL